MSSVATSNSSELVPQRDGFGREEYYGEGREGYDPRDRGGFGMGGIVAADAAQMTADAAMRRPERGSPPTYSSQDGTYSKTSLTPRMRISSVLRIKRTALGSSLQLEDLVASLLPKFRQCYESMNHVPNQCNMG
jgi:hypothetical protein